MRSKGLKEGEAFCQVAQGPTLRSGFRIRLDAQIFSDFHEVSRAAGPKGQLRKKGVGVPRRADLGSAHRSLSRDKCLRSDQPIV
jgi:hypothetical protein